MLRFFRQIRKSLMQQNKVRSYLLYALGEILLVVIGILIALQINTWNEERVNRKQEIFYLGKLSQNMAQDTTYLQQRIEGLTNTETGLQQLQQEIQDPELLEFSDSLSIALLGVQRFSPQTSTMDNLISTGKLDLIQNQSLVDSLFVYYNDLNNYPDQMNNSNDTYTRETIGPRLMQMNGGVFGLEKNALTASDKVFLLNAIQLKLYISRGLKLEYQDTYRQAIRIMDQIHTQITPSDD